MAEQMKNGKYHCDPRQKYALIFFSSIQNDKELYFSLVCNDGAQQELRGIWNPSNTTRVDESGDYFSSMREQTPRIRRVNKSFAFQLEITLGTRTGVPIMMLQT